MTNAPELTIAGKLLDGFGADGIPETGLKDLPEHVVEAMLAYSQAVSLKRIADALQPIAGVTAQSIAVDTILREQRHGADLEQRPNADRLATAAEQIATTLDAIAGLMAAPAAVKGTGADPLAVMAPAIFGGTTPPLQVGDRVRDKDGFGKGRVHAIDGFTAQIEWDGEPFDEENKFWPWSDFEVVTE